MTAITCSGCWSWDSNQHTEPNSTEDMPWPSQLPRGSM